MPLIQVENGKYKCPREKFVLSMAFGGRGIYRDSQQKIIEPKGVCDRCCFGCDINGVEFDPGRHCTYPPEMTAGQFDVHHRDYMQNWGAYDDRPSPQGFQKYLVGKGVLKPRGGEAKTNTNDSVDVSQSVTIIPARPVQQEQVKPVKKGWFW